ncbi:MAG: PBP1A family penicillin-binding protein [Clostridia bacterium]|nr:PBP1A family penicillin-binding protein [Clostridia bacterium]
MKKQKKKNKPNSIPRKILHGIGIFFKVVFVICLVAVAVVSGVIFGALAGFIEDTEPLDISGFSVNLTSFIYTTDSNGVVHQEEALYDDENRVWASLDEIPLNLQRAFIAIEDERFYSHKGFDIKRTVGAAIEYIQKQITGESGTSYGGSTITQQLVKNLTGEDDYSVERKIQEIYRAYKLEQELSKDEILEIYLNTIYLSQHCNGVKSAAKTYFNKELSELTLAECASIAAITQYPTKYDPIRSPENNKERRNVILNKMAELGYITNYDCEVASATDVVTVSGGDDSSVSSNPTSYYTDALINQVIEDLMEQKGYTEAVAEKMLYCGGYRIYSAVDTEIQQIMDDYYADDSNFPTLSGTSDIIQSAMVIIDPATGYVKGIVGGRGEKTASRTLNRATQSLRQSGSSIKPLSIYAPAVEYGKVTASTIVSDSPITIDGWSPRNDDNNFKGNITVVSALSGSRNVPAVRILQYTGLERCFSFVTRNFHISSLVDSETRNGKVYTDKTYAALGLGGQTDGVSVLEMAAAFAVFDARGYCNEPSFYTRVEDSNGNVILERNPTLQPAISETTAVTMTSMLESAVKSGTGKSAQLSNMPVAGKTGTTSDNYDRWFVGYTPYYVGAVWCGCDTPRSLRGLSGNPSATVWKGIMEKIHENLPYKEFNSIGSTSLVLVCADSGLLPNSTCENLTFGEYSKSAAPKRRCDIHAEVDDGEGSLVVYTAPEEDPSETPTGGASTSESSGEQTATPEASQDTPQTTTPDTSAENNSSVSDTGL